MRNKFNYDDPRVKIILGRIEEIENNFDGNPKVYFIREDILRPISKDIECNHYCLRVAGALLNNRKGWLRKQGIKGKNRRRYLVYYGDKDKDVRIFNM